MLRKQREEGVTMKSLSVFDLRSRAFGAFALCVSVAMLSGCASTASAPHPQVTIAQTSAVMPIRAAVFTNVPVTYRLDVSNPLDHDVTLTSVMIETIGQSGSYSMKPLRHSFSRIIRAHTKESLDIRAWVQPLQMNEQGRLSTPVLIRGNAQFQSAEGSVRSAFAERLDQ
jgi:hypothetical protein